MLTDAGSTPARSTNFMKTYIRTLKAAVIMLCVVSCDNHSVHDEIIKQDLHNKQQELIILRELHVAQMNDDDEAREYFMQEYMKIPRLKLTDTQKQHPEYKEWIPDHIIESGDFLHSKYNYITHK